MTAMKATAEAAPEDMINFDKDVELYTTPFRPLIFKLHTFVT